MIEAAGNIYLQIQGCGREEGGGRTILVRFGRMQLQVKIVTKHFWSKAKLRRFLSKIDIKFPYLMKFLAFLVVGTGGVTLKLVNLLAISVRVAL